jgi:H+/Cl- antiporter ClcA
MKPAPKSKTIWAGLAQLVPSVVALVLHYTGVVPLDGEALGAFYTATLTGGLTIYLRTVTREPLGSPSPPPPEPIEPKPRKAPPRPRTIHTLGLMVLLLAGCASGAHTVRDSRIVMACEGVAIAVNKARPLDDDARELVIIACRLGGVAALQAAGITVIPDICPR